MKNQYDAIIIGGGLAGLTLSIRLAKQQFRVALFEKERYPFHKVCGEYIAMESWNYLEECGIPLAKMQLPRITKLQISSPSGNLLTHDLVPGGFGVSRFTLDSMLAQQAREAGVEILEGTKVNEVKRKDHFFEVASQGRMDTARVVLGSYGKRSNLDIRLGRDFIRSKAKGLDNYIGVKYHVLADLPEDLIGLHNFSDGYCGISKVDGDRYCLCYLTTAENLHRSGNDIKRMEREILMRNPFLNTYFQSFKPLYEEPLVISQVSFSPKTRTEDHILMLGDSAGLITPLCGNGMSMAMHASKMLSVLVPQFLRGAISMQALESIYEKQWRKEFSGRLRAGRIFQQLFGKVWVTNVVIASLKHFPSVIRKLVRLTHGAPF